MYYIRKLKPDRTFTLAIPVLVSLTTFIAILGLFGPRPAFVFMAIWFGLLCAINVIGYTHTRSTADLASAIYLGFGSLAYLSVPNLLGTGRGGPFLLPLVGMGASGIWLIHLAVNRRLKWRGRELFELAAMPVDQVGNGYTARPMPAGRVDYTRDEILAFAEFAGRNLIALPIVEADRVVLRLVKMGSEFSPSVWLRPDYAGKSWVSIGFDGEVSVNLAQEDYLDYRQDLSFDQLCASLGNVFVEFVDLFRKGEGVRVLDRMDALQMGILS